MRAWTLRVMPWAGRAWPLAAGLFSLPLVLAGCGGTDECTTEGEVRCDGDVLQECVDGAFEDEEDCAAEGMICHLVMGHCMTPTS